MHIARAHRNNSRHRLHIHNYTVMLSHTYRLSHKEGQHHQQVVWLHWLCTGSRGHHSRQGLCKGHQLLIRQLSIQLIAVQGVCVCMFACVRVRACVCAFVCVCAHKCVYA
jgi:hypothetical protein